MLRVTSRNASPHRPRRVALARTRLTPTRRRIRATPEGLFSRVFSVDDPLAPPRRVRVTPPIAGKRCRRGTFALFRTWG